MQCKVSPYHTGFDATAAAVYLVFVDPTLRKGITKKLYPMVAKALDKRWTTVESDIRYAVSVALDNMEPEDYRRIFRRIPSRRPTAGRFIRAVAATVRRHTR